MPCGSKHEMEGDDLEAKMTSVELARLDTSAYRVVALARHDHECRTMSGMTARTERIKARIDPESAERIRYASALEHTSLSGFMVAAAAEKAERVIAEHAYTLVPRATTSTACSRSSSAGRTDA